MRCRTLPVSAFVLAVLTLYSAPALTQSPKVAAAPHIVRLGPTLIGIGGIRVNTATKELRAPGRVNQVSALEFIANTPKGLKEYESAITMDTTGVAFNTALLLLGLDPARARVPTQHFDPIPPSGDPVEVLVEWQSPTGVRRVNVEELLWNEVTRMTMPVGPWVYTGSVITDGQLLADADGVLIGFVHSPAPLIENPRAIPAKAYGELILNPRLNLAGGTPVMVIVRALDRTGK